MDYHELPPEPENINHVGAPVNLGFFDVEVEDGVMHLGSKTARCPYCQAGTVSSDSVMPSGQAIRFWHLSDTCCRARAAEVFKQNERWIQTYRAKPNPTSQELAEERSLRDSNRDITERMQARKAAGDAAD